MSARSKFEEAVAALTEHNRYGRPLNRATALGVLSGLTDSEIIDRILTNAPGKRVELRQIMDSLRFARTMKTDRKTMCDNRLAASPAMSESEMRENRRRMLPKLARMFVPNTLMKYRPQMIAIRPTAEQIATMLAAEDGSPGYTEADYRYQAARMLRAIYSDMPNARIWAGTILNPEYARRNRLKTKSTDIYGNGIIEAFDLAERLEYVEGMKIPTHISLNPLTGLIGKSGACDRDSFDCLNTIASFRHVLVEFDALKNEDGTPSKEQIDIVGGLIDWNDDHGDKLRVLCAVYTGGKSIHVLLRVPVRSPDDKSTDDRGYYKRQCAVLADLFASAEDARYRIDTSGWNTGGNASTHLRLAGAIRPESGRRARLLYCVD